ncbi:MAG: DsbA family protein [Stagnimonas sp.]|nr:DsbA family protein [Stagnimonas sp.]
MSTVEFFYSFRSPYSYLAAPRIFALPSDFRVRLELRGVRPMVTRGQPVPPAKRLYILRDAGREAQRLGLPFGPVHDPLGEAVWRCLRLCELAGRQDRIAAFVLAAGHAIWAEGADLARDRPMRKVCEQAGLAWQDCLRAFDDPRGLEAMERNTEQLGELGLWGVPSYRIGRHCFWGQDRIVDLVRCLEEAGLRI